MTTKHNWRPSASIDSLRQRAEFIAKIRTFFDNKGVLEVETPTLSQGTVTDVHLEPFQTDFPHHDSGNTIPLFLQTSPEFAMKRLLCAGSGPIYQICKAYRNEAAGRFHNPEFTMLEWYQTGYDDHRLMAELDELIQSLLNTQPAIKISYQQAFINTLAIDPLTISLAELKTFIAQDNDDEWLQQESERNTLLQWLFSMQIEPKLGYNEGKYTPCFVYDFPADQASLAKVNKQNPRVAHRFELYFKGIELANGFYELQDAAEQLTRFNEDNQIRRRNNLAERPTDQRFIEALTHGLPDCAGVAVGIDRLLMLKLNKSDIRDVISFGISNS